MAKKKAAKKRPPRQKTTTILDLNCAFGSVSFGKKTARVGVHVDRENISLPEADNNFCDTRLTLTIHANANGDQKGQGRFPGMEEDIDITGVADVKGFKVDGSTIGFGLTFNKNELKKIQQKKGISFDDFAGREGRVMIAQVDEIPDDEKGDDEPAEDAEPTEGDESAE